MKNVIVVSPVVEGVLHVVHLTMLFFTADLAAKCVHFFPRFGRACHRFANS
jgi:hypothetical protein